MEVSDNPDLPIASLLFPYLKVFINPILQAEEIMEAIQSLPESNLSATVKNLYLNILNS